MNVGSRTNHHKPYISNHYVPVDDRHLGLSLGGIQAIHNKKNIIARSYRVDGANVQRRICWTIVNRRLDVRQGVDSIAAFQNDTTDMDLQKLT